ncbi:Uncharacterized protein Rs2_01834 [Raphanus sativus]|nr:Uncharacterized protein Rs2_01834 [Raphanus sativus]
MKPVESNPLNEENVDAPEDLEEYPNDEEELEGIDLHQKRYPWEGSGRDYLYDEVSISLDGFLSIFESRFDCKSRSVLKLHGEILQSKHTKVQSGHNEVMEDLIRTRFLFSAQLHPVFMCNGFFRLSSY